jgi:uncharacterized protein YndB with AHSA1/START domain
VIVGDSVVHELVLPAPPSEVFDMFVDAEKLVRWIGISADVEPRPDGRFRFEVVPGHYCEGRYVTVDRPHRVVFTWGWSDPSMAVAPGSSTVEVTFEAECSGRSTRLRLVHRGLPDSERGRVLHDDGWARFVARLRAVVAGEEPPDYPTEQPAERIRQLRAHKERVSAEPPNQAGGETNG